MLAFDTDLSLDVFFYVLTFVINLGIRLSWLFNGARGLNGHQNTRVFIIIIIIGNAKYFIQNGLIFIFLSLKEIDYEI